MAGDLFRLAYDGSACASAGELVSTITFYYNMYGADMGTLSLVDATGATRWSLSGNQGISWRYASVTLYSARLWLNH